MGCRGKVSSYVKFFVGIGGMRTGTTWLADFLGSRSDVAIPPFKEVHYWTSKYTRHQRSAVRSIRRLPRRELPAVALQIRQGGGLRLAATYARMLAHSDTAYREYLCLCGGPEARIVGEITPAYATLPPEGFRAIERCLDGPRYILLLRNPADRFISQIGHKWRHNKSVIKSDPLALAGRTEFAVRSDYTRTLEVVRDVIPQDRLLIGYFEHLFDPERGQAECDRICDFLGIDRAPARLGEKLNQWNAPKRDLDRDSIVRHFADQYEGVMQILGPDLPASWTADLRMLRES